MASTGLTVKQTVAGPRRPAGGYLLGPVVIPAAIHPMATARPIQVTPVKPGRRVSTARPVVGKLGLAHRTIVS